MALTPLLNAEQAIVMSHADSRDAVLTAIAERASSLTGLPADAICAALTEKEDAQSTATPEGVAFPHALLDGLDATVLVPVLCRGGVAFGKGQDCDVIVGMFGAASKPFEHVRVLARLARVLNAPGALERIRASVDAHGLVEALAHEDARHA